VTLQEGTGLLTTENLQRLGEMGGCGIAVEKVLEPLADTVPPKHEGMQGVTSPLVALLYAVTKTSSARRLVAPKMNIVARVKRWRTEAKVNLVIGIKSCMVWDI